MKYLTPSSNIWNSHNISTSTSPQLDFCSTLSQNTFGRPPTSSSLKVTIAVLGMLHLVYGTDSPLMSASLVTYSLLHFHQLHMAVHHLLHHLHYHHLHLLLLIQSFILSLRLGSLANPFLYKLFLSYRTESSGLSDNLMFLFCSMAKFVCMLC